MRLARCIVAIAIAGIGALVASDVAGAAEPGQCVVASPLGYCVEWDAPTSGGPGQSAGAGRGRSPDEVVCYWVAIPSDSVSQNPESWIDYGLELPPPGLDVVWQTVECSDGSRRYEFRWVPALTPANLAALARGRIVGLLPQPEVSSSPQVGTNSILRVPVFVEVTNWTGVISESECAGGLCVTVTASPQLTFTPGEPDSSPIACAGSGSRYVPGGGDIDVQANAAGACAYAYRLRTGAQAGRPPEWPGLVSVTWTLSWTADSGASGSLPSVTRSTDVPRGVDEVQTVVVGGETP